MPIQVSSDDLLQYTDWERGKWQAWFREQGGEPLSVGIGPHGDGRFASVGDIIKHIFSAEKRYVERLSDRPLTDTGSIPTDSVDRLFHLGQESRQDLRQLIASLPPRDWDKAREFAVGPRALQATPRKIVVHVLIHEIRHWTQVASLLRLQGFKTELRDFLLSPVLGGGLGSA